MTTLPPDPSAAAPKKRPLAVTIIGFLLIAVELVGLVFASEFNLHSTEFLVASLLRLLAVVGGVFLLLGRNWARWLVVAWMGFHVGLSMLHTAFEVVVHSVFLVVLLVFLFRGPASSYFRIEMYSDRRSDPS
jgi:hypothetical protein